MNHSQQELEQSIVENPSGHLRVLGPPGSGKTTLLIRRFEFLEASAPGTARIITYSRQSLERLLEAVTAGTPAGWGRPPVTTYTTLALQIFPDPPELIGDIEEQLLFDAVVKNGRGGLTSAYESIGHTGRFQNAVLDCCHTLMQNGIGRDRLGVLRAAGCSNRLADIITLYESYLEALGGRATHYDLAWRAAEELEAAPDRNPLPEGSTILIEDFQDIDAGQYALLAALAPPGGSRTLNVFGDPAGARFGFRGTSDRFLLERFPREYGGRTAALPLSPRLPPQLAALAARLLHQTGAADVIPCDPPSVEPHRPGTVRLVTVEDEYAELSWVALQVRSLIDGGSMAPQDIAVVARDKHAYEPVASMVCRQFDIPLETGRAPQTSFRSLIHSLVALIQRGGDEVALQALETSPHRDAVETVLRSRLADTRDDGGGDAGFREMIRRYVAKLARKRGGWYETLARDLLLPVTDSLEAGRAFECKLQLMEMTREWRRYAAFAERQGFARDDGMFAQRSALFADTLHATRPVAGRVGFYSCNQLNNRFFRAVFLVGCAETIFPALSQEERFIPAAELNRLLAGLFPERAVTLYRARHAGRQMQDELGLLFHTVTRASELLVMTAPRRFGGQTVPAPSFILKETLDTARAGSAADDLLPPFARLVRAALRGGSASLEEIASRCAMARYWIEPVAEPEPFRLARFKLSSNSISGFCACERKFFYERVMRIPDSDRLGFMLGALLHELLESVCVTARDRDALLALQDGREVERVVDELVAGREEDIPDGLFKTLFAAQLKSLSGNFFTIEAARDDGYTIEGTEQECNFSRGGHFFTGRIDRVDRMGAGGVAVIDYKTGAQEARKAVTLRERILLLERDDPKRNWQIPLYLWSVLQRNTKIALHYYHYHLPLGREPMALALHLFDGREAFEAAGLPEKNKQLSYLLREELERCIDDATAVADAIFAARSGFEKTDKLERCTRCRFRQFCRRSGRGSE